MKKIIKDSHDMIYYISMLSTTGGKLKVSPRKILENYNRIKKINPKKSSYWLWDNKQNDKFSQISQWTCCWQYIV